ncbi:hypothetical protein APA_1801 [Pseudanabaena sp. lw0831]|nr:hypothetical protein [Pseudanabaena sp. lw0831]GBO53853.1 hypothetical protein APA_1801 [Pseudanabaena sp. lw0831]
MSPEGVQGLKTALQDPNPVVNTATSAFPRLEMMAGFKRGQA